jgi:hypothetical protein
MSRILDEMKAKYGDRKGAGSQGPVTRKQCRQYLRSVGYLGYEGGDNLSNPDTDMTALFREGQIWWLSNGRIRHKDEYGEAIERARKESVLRGGHPPTGERHDIESDTSIIPDSLAETVLEDAARLLGRPLDDERRRLIDHLVERAEHFHTGNPKFRKNVRSEADHGNAGRDYLYGYMCHWISSELLKAHPSRRTRKMLVDSGFSMGRLSSRSDITDAIKRLS